MDTTARSIQTLLRRILVLQNELRAFPPPTLLPCGGCALPPFTGIQLHHPSSTSANSRPPTPIFPEGTSIPQQDRFIEMSSLLEAVMMLSRPATQSPLLPRQARVVLAGQPSTLGAVSSRPTRIIAYDEARLVYERIFAVVSSCCAGLHVDPYLEPVGALGRCEPFFECSRQNADTPIRRGYYPSAPLHLLLATQPQLSATAQLHLLQTVQQRIVETEEAHSTFPTPTPTTHVGLRIFSPLGAGTAANTVVPVVVEIVPFHLLFVRVLLDTSSEQHLAHCFKSAEERGMRIHRRRGLVKRRITATNTTDQLVAATSIRHLLRTVGSPEQPWPTL